MHLILHFAKPFSSISKTTAFETILDAKPCIRLKGKTAFVCLFKKIIIFLRTDD
jgi:hypothetical protein